MKELTIEDVKRIMFEENRMPPVAVNEVFKLIDETDGSYGYYVCTKRKESKRKKDFRSREVYIDE